MVSQSIHEILNTIKTYAEAYESAIRFDEAVDEVEHWEVTHIRNMARVAREVLARCEDELKHRVLAKKNEGP